MRSVAIGLVQMKMGEDRDENIDKAVRMVRTASEMGANLVCLPELFDSPYFPQDKRNAIVSRKIPNLTTQRMSEAAKRNNVVLVAGSIYEKSGNRAYNTSVVFGQDGRVLGKYRKVHLPQDPGFYEQDYFTPGDKYRVFNTKFGNLGVLVCFDQWYPEPARSLKLMGAEIVLYPTAIGTVKGVSQTEGDWRAAWENVQRGHAIANSVVVAAANRVGVEKSLRFWGGSFVCDQFGTLLARADEREQVLVARCDLDLARQVEDGWGFLRNRKPKTYANLVK